MTDKDKENLHILVIKLHFMMPWVTDECIKMPVMLAFESRAQAGKDFRHTGALHSWLGKAKAYCKALSLHGVK